MGSVREIARQVGVSATTVSRAMNNHPAVAAQVRERILSAINRNGYVPKVGRRSTTNIAFVYTGESSLGSSFDAALMYRMSERMDEYGFDLLILSASRAKMPEETFSQMFMRKGIRGAVLRTTTRTRYLCEEIAAEGFPAIVLADRFDDNPAVNFIYSESRNSSREAVEYLVGLGHKRIAISINIVDDSDHADRLAGYREALGAHGIGVDERLVLRAPAYRDGGMQLMRRIHAMSERPTAIYITDPAVAVAAMNEAQRLGMRVPADLSIIGFDDSEARFQVYPQMTAVCQNAAELGRAAFDALHRELDRPRAGEAFVRSSLPTTFEIHRSAGEAGAIAR